MKQKHNIDPVYDKNSRILILGSFPSVKSRESMFFYHHPQNRFWKVLAYLHNQPIPLTIDDKKTFLLQNNIAVWDVIESCDITNSSDSTIKNVKPNDISKLLKNSHIQRIFANGNKAFTLYNKHIKDSVGIECTLLPSTSPANASYSLEKLCEEWQIIK